MIRPLQDETLFFYKKNTKGGERVKEEDFFNKILKKGGKEWN